MNASFGCKGEIHLEVVEMFPSRRGSLSLGSKETSPSLSEFAGTFLVITFPVAQEDGEAVGARVFQHLVAAAVLCCHAQRVQNLCFDGGEYDGEFGRGVADDDRAFHRGCTLFVLGQEDADRRVVAHHFGVAATDHDGACRGDDLVDAAGRAVGDGIDDRACLGCAVADHFRFFQLAAQELPRRVGNAQGMFGGVELCVFADERAACGDEVLPDAVYYALAFGDSFHFRLVGPIEDILDALLFVLRTRFHDTGGYLFVVQSAGDAGAAGIVAFLLRHDVVVEIDVESDLFFFAGHDSNV